MHSKNVLGIVLATLVLMTTIVAAFPMAAFADAVTNYKTVQGVLYSDHFEVYPYEKLSLDIGFSKYGEMISLDVPAGKGSGIGLQYPGYDTPGVETYDQTMAPSRDPFANEFIDQTRWINGWMINMSYRYRWQAGVRHVWAFAMFADGTAYDYDWLNGVADPRGAPNGGRKTNAKALSENLRVLYDGPRRFVAVSETHIFDWKDTNGDGVVDHPDETWPLADVIITVIFNKVKKSVILLKDVKLTISGMDLIGKVDVEFSNRNFWYLGLDPSFASYAQFYHQDFDTCYGGDWHKANAILRKYEEKFTGDDIEADNKWELIGAREREVGKPLQTGMPVAEGSEKVYKDGVLLEPVIDYTLNYDTGSLEILCEYETTSEFNVEYKVIFKYLIAPETGTIVVGIEPDDQFTPTEYVPIIETVVEGEPTEVSHRYDVAQIIAWDKEVVGFAAFWPTCSDYTVDGWSDWYHSLRWIPPFFSLDTGMAIEPDLPFVIGEWDFQLGLIEGENIQFRGVTVYGLTDWHDAEDPDADIDGDTEVTDWKLDKEVEYQLAEIFNPFDLKDAAHKTTRRYVKFIEGPLPALTVIDLYPNALYDVIEGAPDPYEYCSFAERVVQLPDGELLERGPDYQIVNPGDLQLIKPIAAGETWKILWSSKVTKIMVDGFIAWWTIAHRLSCWPVVKNSERVFINDVIQTKPTDYTIDYATGWVTFTSILPPLTEVKITYLIYSGRFEWVVVGRDARTVDSAGAALVTAALKNKQIEIQLAGMDMDSLYYPETVPFVLKKFGAGNAKIDYRDAIGRNALLDDWCTMNPITSSNIIGVGGPLANELTRYFNSFTQAFHAYAPYAIDPSIVNTIFAPSKWGPIEDRAVKDVYEAGELATGYAVIAVYKDLDGTIGLVIWGETGPDTFQACRWFHENIHELQEMNEHVTAIILKIDYRVECPDGGPLVTILNEVGTISEKHPEDC